MNKKNQTFSHKNEKMCRFKVYVLVVVESKLVGCMSESAIKWPKVGIFGTNALDGAEAII